PSASDTTPQPNTVARPASGVSRVPRMRISVDLPLPFGPRMPVTPPLLMTRSSSWSATLSLCSGRHQRVPFSRLERRNDWVIPCSSTAAATLIDLLTPLHSPLEKQETVRAQPPHGPV